ncbi:MAG: glycoside hydrolase/phage tail family protein [Sulfitobacter litoralis]|uniref:Phage tail protein n=1 Tax=Sulfitobacter litoralis TaxID=335975 RepID=A0ABY0SF31_9RHOB|nr:glycoside hydrolase/phage tail family protein [Sulfitobacter litoralis]MBQ0715932.1 glycoside hydrolase/phage tail family protein [Sulfitobacter litoralis]MBQ0801744.1 glycoside hydrolase/phage tail family protein [Sulfitobacter litoralis]SDP09411.1 Putative phage tail protein [Sulfitobacter litoralis]
MATILLSTAGAAIGGSVGGTLAGLSSVAVGRAVGATLGRVIDQRLLGQGAQAVETGKVDRFRVTQAGEGAAVPQVFGRMRVGGQVIWASDFAETTTVTGGGGGKGAPSTPQTTEYSYSVSLAIALCEGEITSVGRIWADGEEISVQALNIAVYRGTGDQLPDPTIAAIEGADDVPAYRGTAYVVMENLALGQFGNRVPQFSFEVLRAEEPGAPDAEISVTHGVKGVALIPGTGEYALATTPVHYSDGKGGRWSANVSTPDGRTDFVASLEDVTQELPQLAAASLVVSWFGNDLRCGECRVRPMVESAVIDGENMPWQVAGLVRGDAEVIAREDDRPVYGGTPTDASVIEAIHAMNAAGKAVMFYPFILMDQLDGNTLPDPYSDAATQPKLPWRGRITLDRAPGRAGSTDGTLAAHNEVAQFFGTVTAADFSVAGGEVVYTGPQEWSMSRFILHYAALCKAAGGVDAFCIGTEMRGLTQIRGAGNSFVAVQAFRALAAEARTLLGSDTKISYAADWSEYFGYHPQDGSGDVFFHLDPLWADENIDFIGIDTYMPLSDWRDGSDHLDAQHSESIYALNYLSGNVAGGEGFDWFYHSPEARAAQIRTPITDGAYGEPWVYRYKDLRGWWENLHHDRIGGVRAAEPTGWKPGSKPIWFTEYGCAAVDKGTNQPNKFLDLKSSESSLPRYSTGARDELMQMQYLRALARHWRDAENNPLSAEYGGPMVDMTRAFVWAWDTRPYPFFPNNRSLWNDGQNYARGHWLNGRSAALPLSELVASICRRAGLNDFDTSGLYGYVRGYVVDEVADARAALQPLMLRFGFDVVQRDGMLRFIMRDGLDAVPLAREVLAVSGDLEAPVEKSREAEAELLGRMRLRFVQADGDYDTIAEEAVLPDDATHAVATSELNMALTRAEGHQTAERWLTEARVAREGVRLALPPSMMAVGAGDVIVVPPDEGEGGGLYRVDRVETGELSLIDAVRIEPEVYAPAPFDDELIALKPFVAPVPVHSVFLDLPLLRGDEVPHAPYFAATARQWPGNVAVYASRGALNFRLNTVVPLRATMGVTHNDLLRARPGILDRGRALQVTLSSGGLESIEPDDLLGGGNLAAIGDGTADRWEVFQFTTAELIAPQTYLLRDRLRGQAGSDGLMPEVWPSGSQFVLLNSVPRQIELGPNLLRIAQTYRIGPAARPLDDPSYVQKNESFNGNGLRPYRPCHLRVEVEAGEMTFNWVRRTRLNGDKWSAFDLPIGEESEQYQVRIMQNGAVLREETVDSPRWTYPESSRLDDGGTGLALISVTQISALYGAGPALFGKINL